MFLSMVPFATILITSTSGGLPFNQHFKEESFKFLGIFPELLGDLRMDFAGRGKDLDHNLIKLNFDTPIFNFSYSDSLPTFL